MSTARRALTGLFVCALAVGAASCGGGGDESPPPTITPSSGSAFIFIGDTPPLGSTVLKFEITLSSAVICPQVSGNTCQGSPQTSLISQPIEIELSQLELESAFLNIQSLPAGTFQGAQLTFANPELKLLLADNTIVELEPPDLQVSPATVTPTFPGGLTVTADTNFGFLVDFNVFDSIQSSGNLVTGISPVVTLVQLPALANETIEELEDVTGRVSNLNKTCPTGTFTLIESITGLPISDIRFDDTTEFEDLTCDTLANDQVVEADLELRMGATLQSAEFFAEEIEFVNPPDPNELELEGLVFQVNSASQFVLLVQEEEGAPSVAIGSLVSVNLATNTNFRIDDDDVLVDPLDFDTGDDLLAGQKIEVDVENGSLSIPSGADCADIADNCTAIAEKVKLKEGSLTGRVAGVSGTTFTLDQLPSLFGSSAAPRRLSADCQSCFVGSILVTTSLETEFKDDLTGIGGLTVGDIVTVRGLLLKGSFSGPPPGTTFPNVPELVAEKVRRRPS